LEQYLQSNARDGVQVLINSLFSLPVQKTQDGPLAVLPPIETPLPRAKPLPKPKPPTKWEVFARAKGIQKKIRDKKVWDEEKQEWVQRWGRHGKNKETEEQWITEIPDNARTFSFICISEVLTIPLIPLLLISQRMIMIPSRKLVINEKQEWLRMRSRGKPIWLAVWVLVPQRKKERTN
jgi:hypothetical protein